MENKIKASIMGFAIGDAMGVPIEFTERNFFENRFIKEMIGYGTYNVPEGTWSDDTSLMLATLDSIANCAGINYEDIMQRFLKWYQYAEYTATDEVFDIGISTKKSLLNYISTKLNAIDCGMNSFNENGNGSLMRILPIVLYIDKMSLSTELEVEILNNVSSLTHKHEISRVGCKIYCDFIKKLLHGKNKVQIVKEFDVKDYDKFYSLEAINVYNRILSGEILNLKRDDIKSTGFVVDTLEASLWCILKSNNFEETIINAINLGNDTDTIGAITGSIAGIIYGMESIPSRWLDKLQKREYINNLITEFNNCLNLEVYNSKKTEKLYR